MISSCYFCNIILCFWCLQHLFNGNPTVSRISQYWELKLSAVSHYWSEQYNSFSLLFVLLLSNCHKHFTKRIVDLIRKKIKPEQSNNISRTDLDLKLYELLILDKFVFCTTPHVCCLSKGSLSTTTPMFSQCITFLEQIFLIEFWLGWLHISAFHMKRALEQHYKLPCFSYLGYCTFLAQNRFLKSQKVLD